MHHTFVPPRWTVNQQHHMAVLLCLWNNIWTNGKMETVWCIMMTHWHCSVCSTGCDKGKMAAVINLSTFWTYCNLFLRFSKFRSRYLKILWKKCFRHAPKDDRSIGHDVFITIGRTLRGHDAKCGLLKFIFIYKCTLHTNGITLNDFNLAMNQASHITYKK